MQHYFWIDIYILKLLLVADLSLWSYLKEGLYFWYLKISNPWEANNS